MHLRHFIFRLAAVLLWAAVHPNLAFSQASTTTMSRVGLLAWPSCDAYSLTDLFGPFLVGMKELGYEPGKNIAFECRGAGLRYDGLAEAAADLAELSVDVIVSTSQPAGHAARKATATIPIVTIISGDPVAASMTRSLAKPDGNVTGVSYYATELTAKRLALLQEIIPAIDTVGVLANPDTSYLPFEEDTRLAEEHLGINTRIYHVSDPAELKQTFFMMEADGVQAVFVLPDLMFAWEASRIADLALKHGLPTMAWGGWFTESGCLMAYSSDYRVLEQRLAFYVDRILQGAKPSDLPIEQPTTFRLSINLKTAEALGLEVPQSILLLADEVIE